MTLTAAQVAARVGVSVQAVNKAAREGRLPPVNPEAWSKTFSEAAVKRWAKQPRKPWRNKDMADGLTPADISKQFGIPPQYTNRSARDGTLAWDGTIKVLPSGHRTRVFAVEDVQAWAAQHEAKAEERFLRKEARLRRGELCLTDEAIAERAKEREHQIRAWTHWQKVLDLHHSKRPPDPRPEWAKQRPVVKPRTTWEGAESA